MNIFHFSRYFLKLAALEWSQDTNWVPEEFKNKDSFKNHPFKNALKIFKKFGLEDFRTVIDIESNIDLTEINEKLKYRILYELDSFIINFSKIDNNLKNNILKYIVGFKKYLTSSDLSEKYNTTDIYHNNDKLFLKGQSIFKIYNTIKNKLKKINYIMLNLEEFQEFKDYSNAQKPSKVELVFSSKTSDICGMGSRGIITCQNLFNEDFPGYSDHLVGSILSKYLGICYITNGSDYKNRGEKMLYRALVRFIINGKTNKPEILIDRLYPNENNKKILDIMKQELQKRSKITVISILETDLSSYYLRDESNIPNKMESYLDSKIEKKIPHKKLLYLLNSNNSKKRELAASKLVNDYPMLIATHSNKHVRMYAAVYADLDQVGLILAKDQSDLVRNALAKHILDAGFNYRNYPEIFQILLNDNSHTILGKIVIPTMPPEEINYIKTLSKKQQQKIIANIDDEEDKEILINGLNEIN